MEMFIKMTDSYTTNLEAHYSTNPKTSLPQKIIAQPPETIPVRHLFNDRDANARLKILNQDIYEERKKEKNKDVKTFIKWFGGIVLAILAFIGIKKFF